MPDGVNTPASKPTTDGASFLPPDWAQLQPLLDELLDVPIEHRTTRLAELTHGNSALQRQLEKLLAEAERDATLLDRSVTHRFNELANDDSMPALPEVLAGRYRVGRELGRGGMACVYLARDEKHGRDVAIKVINPKLSASMGHERFLREIEIAARLRHPNIVPLYDSGEVDGSPNEQAAIADSIAGSLTAELRRQFPHAIGVAPARSTHQRTSNTEAYRLYVKGEEKLARRGEEREGGGGAVPAGHPPGLGIRTRVFGLEHGGRAVSLVPQGAGTAGA